MKSFFVFSLCFALSSAKQLLLEARNSHIAEQLSDEEVQRLAQLSDVAHVQKVLDKILVPRVVGTPTHSEVHQYIIKELQDLGWTVEIDKFKDNVPILGKLTFKNIIAKLNPVADRYLTLACHYDTKYFEDNNFVGATDSAVPCAMLLNLAKVLKNELDSIKDRQSLSLQLIFFDGEEAFEQWGPKDSIYGARHLARKMKLASKTTSHGETVNELLSIDVLVLLDLIGAPDPTFYCFYEQTLQWYKRLVAAERRLSTLGQLANYKQVYFQPSTYPAHIEDDHIPFLLRGVPILHLITNPFPKVWHTPADNGDNIDMDTIENLNKIMRIFVVEYLHLSKQAFDDGSSRTVKVTPVVRYLLVILRFFIEDIRVLNDFRK